MTNEPEPPGGGRPVLQRRRRGALAPTLAILGVLVVLALVLASVWTDVLWYSQLGFLRVYSTRLLTETALFLVGGLVMGGAVLSSLLVAYRGRPIYVPVGGDQASLDRYRETIEPLRRLVAIAVPAALALFAGSATAQQWQTVLLWWNGVPFNTVDDQFHKDISFFVFGLPWYQYLTGYLSIVVFLTGLVAVVTHYLYGGVRLQGGGPRLTDTARLHLSVLAMGFLLLRGVDYYLSRFSLTTKDSRRITGLTYTDANAVLTARTVLAGIAVIVAVLFLVGALVERFRLLPLYGVALLVVSAILVGGIYPAVVQRFTVKPNEQVKEEPYLTKAIRATRAAYDLTSLQVTAYPAQPDVSQSALEKDPSLSNIRIIDPSVVSDTFRQLEQNKGYYGFADSLDIDRYQVQGKQQDAVVAARELSLDEAPASQRSWVNDHLVYTHGFGVVAAYGNRATPNGQPSFMEFGIPSQGVLGTYEPRIYFGEKSPDYSIVGAPKGAPQQELDYPTDNGSSPQANTTYSGKGGVSIGSAFNRLLYAIKFREQNILLSNGINASSRILYDRQPRQRVQKVAPFLTLDGDPYPAVVGGRVVWIVDGYTTSDRYPYSATQTLDQATTDSVTASRSSVVALRAQTVNYIRNSVKATVDAYDGTVTLYTWDEQDPVLKAWKKVFPGLVQPRSAISGDLMSHLRYPEDLFKVQRQLLAQYHVTNPGSFYSQTDSWAIPDDPTVNNAGSQPPYFLTLQMPGQQSPAFSLTSTFIPNRGANGANTRNVLTGFLSVDADAGAEAGKPRQGYGTLRLLQLPRDTTVSAPGQVQQSFGSYPPISNQINNLKLGGAGLEFGNLLTLPVGGGLLYVQPLYVRASGTGSYPLLRLVMANYGSTIGFSSDLTTAVNQALTGSGTSSGPGTPGGGTSTPTGSSSSPPSSTSGSGTPPPTGDAQARLQSALADARTAIADADAALKRGDFAAYGQAQAKLKAAIEAATAAQVELGTTGGTPSSTPSSSVTRSPSPTASSSSGG